MFALLLFIENLSGYRILMLYQTITPMSWSQKRGLPVSEQRNSPSDSIPEYPDQKSFRKVRLMSVLLVIELCSGRSPCERVSKEVLPPYLFLSLTSTCASFEGKRCWCTWDLPTLYNQDYGHNRSATQMFFRSVIGVSFTTRRTTWPSRPLISKCV